MQLRVSCITLRLAAVAAFGLVAVSLAEPANAFPSFARKYNLPCARCHSMVPRMTPFGYAFYRAGFRMPANNKRSYRFSDVASFITQVNLQRGTGQADIQMPEIDLAVAGPIEKNFSGLARYIHSYQTGTSSAFDEIWGQYNSSGRAPYWSVRVGQFPILDGYQLLGNRNFTATGPMLFDSTGPLTDPSQTNFALGSLERGIQLGYVNGTLYNRFSILQGVDETGTGTAALTGGQHWTDFVLQSEYLIGKEGSALGAFYYNGRTPFTTLGYTDPVQRAGLFGTWAKQTGVRALGIPDYRFELNGGFVYGHNRTTVDGQVADSWGGVTEAAIYMRNRSSLALRYDSVLSSSASATPVSDAWTIALQHRPNGFAQLGLEYRRQHQPRSESLIGTIKLTY